MHDLRRMLLVVACVALATACSASGEDAAPSNWLVASDSPTPTHKPPPHRSDAHPTGPAPTSAPPSANISPTVAPTRAAPPKACTTSNLAISVKGIRRGDDESTWEDFVTELALKNRSQMACALGGWAGITLRGNGSIRVCEANDPSPQCGQPVDKNKVTGPTPVRIGTNAPTFIVNPGESATFDLLWDGLTCWHPIWRAQVQLPGSPATLDVVFHDENVAPCVENDDGPSVVRVAAFSASGAVPSSGP